MPDSPTPPATGAAPAAPRSAVVRAVTGGARLVASSVGGARDGVARLILAAGFTPNTVTLVGPIVLTPVFIALYTGHQRWGGILLVAASSFDLLDGTVARLGGQVTRFGAFLDSVVDRYSDFIIFAGILVFFLRHTGGAWRNLYLVVWALALLGSLLPAYIRARAETIIPLCKVGFMERAERTVTIFIGAVSGNLHIAIIILAIYGNWMSVERILYTREQLEPESKPRWVKLWRHERVTPPHAVMCATLIALLIFGHHLIPRP